MGVNFDRNVSNQIVNLMENEPELLPCIFQKFVILYNNQDKGFPGSG